MRLGFLIITGLFVDIMLSMIFPYQLLSTSSQNNVINGDNRVYNGDNIQYFSSNLKSGIGSYINTSQDQTRTGSLIDTSNNTNTNPITAGVSSSLSYFDYVANAMEKIKVILSIIIPYASLFFLLPSALGYILGSLYTGALIYAVIRFIRGT